jgi:hypothetical protein
VYNPPTTNDYQRQDLNIPLPPQEVTNSDGTTSTVAQTSAIDQWRNAAISNPESNRRASASDVLNSDLAFSNAIKNQLVGAGVDIDDDSELSLRLEDEFSFYSQPGEWTLATQYGGLEQQTIAIENGKATLTIPASDVDAFLIVQASYFFGDESQFEMILSDAVFNANPVDVSSISPGKIDAEGPGYVYEIGVPVKFMNSAMADDVVVKFKFEETNASPLVSKTDGGFAGGVVVGPHDIIEMNFCELPNGGVIAYGEYEPVSIKVSYLGYERTMIRSIEWTGPDFSEEDESNLKYFSLTAKTTGSAYADGDSSAEFDGDLDTPLSLLGLGTDGINALQGENQTDNLPAVIATGSNLPELDITTTQGRWYNPSFELSVSGLNRSIGFAQPQTPEEAAVEDNIPWDVGIRATSFYQSLEDNPIPSLISLFGRYARGTDRTPYISDAGAGFIIDPEVSFSEPLGINSYIESYNGDVVRDGVTSYDVVAYVTWKGNLIKHTYLKNEGKDNETEIEFPFPFVAFRAGTCLETNGEPAGDLIKYKDTRSSVDSCLRVQENSSVIIDTLNTQASINRTDETTVGNFRHLHVVEIDENGNGITTAMKVMSGPSLGAGQSVSDLPGVTVDHVHEVINYKVQETDGHTHNLRCAAVTQIEPTSDIAVNMVVNSYAIYDPTNATAYDPSYGEVPGSTVNLTTLFGDNPPGNRMMFDSVKHSGVTPRERELLLTVTIPESIITSESATDTDKGFNIEVCAKFSEYDVEIGDGVFQTIPEEKIEDGTRIILGIETFKPIKALADVSEDGVVQADSEILVRSPDTVRNYMYLKIIATVFADGLSATEEVFAVVVSNLNWLPSVMPLVLEPTNDSIDVSNAIAQIGTLGASQINDAVKLAGERLTQFELDDDDIDNFRKFIFLLSDGDENSSEFSSRQAVDAVNFVDGECNVPVVPVKLGLTYVSDEVILQRYAVDTCSDNFSLINSETSDITALVDDIISNGNMGTNKGVYTNTIDLGDRNLPKSISIESILLPAGTRLEFRYRSSDDGVKFGPWSEYYDSASDIDIELDLENVARYFQYEVRFFGSENFESPSLTAGATLVYYKVQNFVVFFQPTDLDLNSDEYLGSIHITHEATIPDTSSVHYGVAQFDTTNIDDYSSNVRQDVTPDRHSIQLTRYNELFLTSDRRTYTAINGAWSAEGTMEVWRINDLIPEGELVDPSEYRPNNVDGTITFINTQPETDTFFINIFFDPVFRIICSTTNYGPDPVVIDHIGVMYNTTKRIPFDSQGNIVRGPLRDRLR